ncbi:hypothetical protein [uncultured Methanomethylovorans sp.]|uniref:hypothetical protein n=1 Tax=uncultured Methanomethylovorans sp. TaxID=183759 RepID=UPI0026362F75|nr:hypothetical protein [uncultured Methanomethylovorans sp.]
MNTSTLDKATDKIIGKMTPEELGKYFSDFSQNIAKNIDAGIVSSEEGERQLETQVQKHINTLPPHLYVRFQEALTNACLNSTMQEWGKAELKIIGLRASIIELLILLRVTADGLYGHLCLKEHGKDTAEEIFAKTILETIGRTSELLKKLEDLKKEREDFLILSVWERFGGAPQITDEFKSVLDKGNIDLYCPEK